MQDLTPIIKEGRKVIETYGAGSFTISSAKYDFSIIITPFSLKESEAKNISEITENDISILIDEKDKIDFVLVGFGENSDYLPTNIEKILAKENIRIEYMSTGAACRTYNVLMSEERKIAAILIAI
ncbi:MAG TPA: hypothetical protein DIV86_07560 [Alphaproteobacteria bacterium]|nr:hypothetical protein [Alphaproteobacteria bacterium]